MARFVKRRSLFLIVPLIVTVLDFVADGLLAIGGIRLPVVVAVVIPNLLLASLVIGAILWISLSIADANRRDSS
jgi:hypothetical protein